MASSPPEATIVKKKPENVRDEADESNSHKLLINIEESLVYYQNKLNKEGESDQQQQRGNNRFQLVDRDEFRKQLVDIYTDLIETHMPVIKKCVLSKSFTKKAIATKETCVRLLTRCVQQSFAYAKVVF